jgi:hypothetical protein
MPYAFYLYRLNYPLNTFFKEMFLVFATAIGSRKVANAFTVAFTTLCGLAEPRLFANTSVIPAASNTARMLPPAIHQYHELQA